MTPLQQEILKQSSNIARLAEMANKLAAVQDVHAKALLDSQMETAVVRTLLVALAAAYPDKEQLHAAIQGAWNAGRGSLGIPGVPDEALGSARSLLKSIGDVLGKPIL
jgi:hemoglobin-like flavoprotein